MADNLEEWSAREARRISRIAMCVPEALRAECIAHMMVGALNSLSLEQRATEADDPR